MNTKRFNLIMISLFGGFALVFGSLSLVSAQSVSARADVLTSLDVTVRYVSTNGTDTANDCVNSAAPCRTVQRAIQIAQDSDEIRVATGIYTGTMTAYVPYWSDYATATVVITKGITSLLGGYSIDFSARDPNSYITTLDAAASPGDWVIFITGTNTLVDGFTVTGSNGSNVGYGAGIRVNGGSPTISHNNIQNNHATIWGGGIYVTNNASPTISANVIYSNTSDDDGSGIYIRSGTVVITGNTIISNSAGGRGGGILVQYGSASIISNTISYNRTASASGYGGGSGVLMVNDASGIIQDNIITYNSSALSGAGIEARDSATVTIKHNAILFNTALQQGSVNILDSATAIVVIEGNDIRNNQATSEWSGGGINVENMGQPVILTNNVIVNNSNSGIRIANVSPTIANNTVVQNGAMGIEVFTWPPTQTVPYTATLVNNIVVGHADCGIHAWNSMNPIIDYNDIWNNANNYCNRASPPSGSNNIHVDPQFVNGVTGDYRLQFSSPAMDKGTNAGAPAYDKNGVIRPQGSFVDIGAYEVIILRLFLPLLLRR